MSHVPHELAEEFPEYREKMHALKMESAHFARLSDEYHEVNRAIHRMQERIEPVSEDAEEEMRKKRLALKDEIASILRST